MCHLSLIRGILKSSHLSTLSLSDTSTWPLPIRPSVDLIFLSSYPFNGPGWSGWLAGNELQVWLADLACGPGLREMKVVFLRDWYDPCFGPCCDLCFGQCYGPELRCGNDCSGTSALRTLSVVWTCVSGYGCAPDLCSKTSWVAVMLSFAFVAATCWSRFLVLTTCPLFLRVVLKKKLLRKRLYVLSES